MLFEILSLLPFFLIFYFMVIKEKKAFKVMFSTYLITVMILLFMWNLEYSFLGLVSLRGMFQALEIYLIIFAVLLLFNLMKVHGSLENVKDFMKEFTHDKNVLIILIGWFLVSFFEAIAGFGTPAAICAPLLVLLGIRPLTAVILTLIADSTAVSFGAFGVPILFGIKNSVGNPDIASVVFHTSLINSIIGLFMPLVLLIIYNLIEHKHLKDIKKYVPFALVSGLVFSILYFVTANFLSIELTSVVASLVGLVLMILFLYSGVFFGKTYSVKNFNKLFNSFLPYLFIIVIFVLSRLDVFNFGTSLKRVGFDISFPNGISNFAFSIYSPGFIILSIFVIFVLVYKLNKKEFNKVVSESFNKSKYALVTLLFTLAFVNLLIYSGNSDYNLSSMPVIIASMFTGLGTLYILFAPMIGAFGSFIAGSATVSNLIFGGLQNSIAIQNSLNPSLILALQNIGASAGNMIAIHNIIAVSTLVGLKNQESKIIKRNILVVLGYCLVASFIAYLVLMF